MSLNSVNTNMGAMVALQSLESTQAQLASTQKQISTGYRVADATDDGAAYAIAQCHCCTYTNTGTSDYRQR